MKWTRLVLVAALVAAAAASSGSISDNDTTNAVTHNDNKDATSPSTTSNTVSDSFSAAFVASFMMILLAEIGDRTFFIAAIMAMKHPRLLVFTAALSALIVMTVISAVLGYAVPNLIPRVYTYYLALLFFVFFGVRMLREWQHMSDDEGQEELAEAEDEIKEVEAEMAPEAALEAMESGKAQSLGKTQRHSIYQRFFVAFLPVVWVNTFVLTFLAEWGDRSQLTTIAMATAQNPWGITLGGISGHAVCTGIAVLGGRLLAQRISVKTVTLLGAILFILFAVIGFVQGPDFVESAATQAVAAQ